MGHISGWESPFKLGLVDLGVGSNRGRQATNLTPYSLVKYDEKITGVSILLIFAIEVTKILIFYRVG